MSEHKGIVGRGFGLVGENCDWGFNMSDSDLKSAAWRMKPSAYLGARPASFAISKPQSQYLRMRDGCGIAVDVYFPADEQGAAIDGPFPTIIIFTCYNRRTTATIPTKVSTYIELFVPRGYAVVVVDTRGSGASFGSRDGFRSPEERLDSAEIAEWIVRQPWSNGRIGATGISYMGAASDFLASTGHPSVKAIAPLFAIWDTYTDHYYPGGLLNTNLVNIYGNLIADLDVKVGSPGGKPVDKPWPVDDDVSGELCDAAVAEHAGNFQMANFMWELRSRDSALIYDPGYTSASISPYSYMSGLRPDVAVYSVSGWYDGSGYANSSIARFLSIPNTNKHLLLGPWDHGQTQNISLWRENVLSDFPLMGEILRFFDEYLGERETGIRAESPIHYFNLREEQWIETDVWPPVSSVTTFFLSAGNRLATQRPDSESRQSYKVDFSVGAGTKTRNESIATVYKTDLYSDWQGKDEKMLCFESDPLDGDYDLAGHGVVDLKFACSEPDCAIHVFLSEVEANGTVRYVTDGQLRALYREEAEAPASYDVTWPYRTFSKDTARTIGKGEIVTMRFALLPIAWRFKVSSKIRVAISGAEIDHFEHVPAGRFPVLDLLQGGENASSIELPLKSA